MAAVVDRGRGHPLTRPFLGVGVLGGYTTFSTYAVQSVDLADRGDVVLAAAYVVGSVVAGLLAVVLGQRMGRR
jgi:CrcB protein